MGSPHRSGFPPVNLRFYARGIAARTAATEVVEQLLSKGFVAYFAGGCVRDGLLGREPEDFDVATDARPEDVRRFFPSAQGVGAAFGVMLVRVRHHTIEVATFRADGPYTDARRPDSVEYSDPKSDAARRDFTINSLFLDPTKSQATPEGADVFDTEHGRVIDFFGGRKDLEAKTLRAVGDPDARLTEDHLRALRAVRFAARLGFVVDPDTVAAITRHARDLGGVSRERIGDELRRMLAHPTRAQAVSLLAAWNLALQVFGCPIRARAEMSVLADLPAESSFPLSLAAATLDLGLTEQPGLTQTLRRALMLSNEESEGLSYLLARLPVMLTGWAGMSIAQKKRGASHPLFSDLAELCMAVNAGVASRIVAEIQGLAADGVGLDPPRLLTGDHLIAEGWKPGPGFKRVLEEVFDSQLEGRIKTFEQARELAIRMRV